MALISKPNFSTGSAINPYAGLQSAMANIKDDTLRRSQLKATKAQQAIANARADRQLELTEAAAQRTIDKDNEISSNEALLSKLYSEMPSTKTVTEDVVVNPAIPSKPGNEDERRLVDNLNTDRLSQIDKLNKEVAQATEDYNLLLTAPTIDVVKAPPSNDKEVVLREYPNVPGESKRTYYETSDGKKIDAMTKWFGGYDEVDNFTKAAIPVPDEGPELSRNDQALKDSGLMELNKKLEALGVEKSMPKEISATKAVPAEITQVQKSIALKPEEQVSQLKNNILNSSLPGSVKEKSIANIDKMFPSNGSMKQSDRIALANLQLKIKQAESKATDKKKSVEGYKALYPSMPSDITTLEGAKAFERKLNKSTKGKGDFIASLYDDLTTKDSGDWKAVDKWISENRESIDKLSTSQKNAMKAKMKALYAQESDIDLTDYFGGSAFGDIADEFKLKK